MLLHRQHQYSCHLASWVQGATCCLPTPTPPHPWLIMVWSPWLSRQFLGVFIFFKLSRMSFLFTKKCWVTAFRTSCRALSSIDWMSHRLAMIGKCGEKHSSAQGENETYTVTRDTWQDSRLSYKCLEGPDLGRCCLDLRLPRHYLVKLPWWYLKSPITGYNVLRA